MPKVDDVPETDDQVHPGVQPRGQALQVSQSFCHVCHATFDASDPLGHPPEEVRASN
jgi:hypothetical protein